MQIRNSFDRETLLKIGKSFLYAGLSGLSAGLACYAQTKSREIALITGLSAFTSFLVNIPIEYKKGEYKNEVNS